MPGYILKLGTCTKATRTGIGVSGAPGPPETMGGGLVCGGAVWGCFRAYMEKQYPQIWQFWAPKSAENLVPGRPGTKFSTPALVPTCT